MKETKRLHIRRCHLCGGITECHGRPVKSCGHCGKHLAPFYFFNDTEVDPLSDVDSGKTLSLKSGQRFPLRGFTAHW